MIMTQNRNDQEAVFRPRGASLLEDEPILSETLVDVSAFSGFLGGNGGFDDDTLSSFSGSEFGSESEGTSMLGGFDDVDFAAHNAFDALEDVPDDASTVSALSEEGDAKMDHVSVVASSVSVVEAAQGVGSGIGSLVSDASMRISDNRMSLLDRIGASSFQAERQENAAPSHATRQFRSTPAVSAKQAAAAAAAPSPAARSGKYVGHYDPAARAERIKRFHEKRLRRRWGKRIKYMDRKLQAENQKRVRGRFAKVDPALKAAANAAKLESPLH